jgi:hypothetical protein
MIPVDNTQNISVVGETQSIGKVTTTLKNTPFLINLVTDRIYKDKQAAIIREYSTNAWDAHIEAKLPISDIIVTLPTLKEPTLRIRDFGAGLTTEQVANVYCILGESTKRGSNEFNGQLGLGCKSGFGYGDSFIVTSFVNGEKFVYNIIKGDDHKEGEVLLMSKCPLAPEDRTGIEVAIPIKTGDLEAIQTKASNFFKHWEVLPTIHNMIPEVHAKMMKWRSEVPFLSGEGWTIRPRSDHFSGSAICVALMGQVAYPIDWGMLSAKLAITAQKRIFLEILRSNDVVLSFPIGSLKFLPNREELEYTDTTYKNLEGRIEAIFGALESAVVAKFANAKSIWDAKRVHLALFGKNIGEKEDALDDSEVENTSTEQAIKILDGDFYRLESMFTGKLFWNGIQIDSPHFSKMHAWDLERPDHMLEDIQSAIKPCLITYSKKKTRVKRHLCTLTDYNRITPYNGVKVVVVDNRSASLGRAVARFYLLSEGSTVRRVHILRFDSDDQKAAFFDYYNFDTAQYTNMSAIQEEVKAWSRANRKSYNRGLSDGGTAKLRYIDVENDTLKEEEVSLRDLEDGGIFVGIHRKDAIFADSPNRKMDHIATHISALVEHAGIEIDRIYCLPQGKLEAKWFQAAKDEGLWTELKAYLKENVEVIVSSDMRRRYHYNQFEQTNRHGGINQSWMQAIIAKLNGASDEFNALGDVIEPDACDFSDLNDALGFFGFPEVDFGNSPINYERLLERIHEKYPLLEFLNLGGYCSVDKERLTAVVNYIQQVDAANKVLTGVLEFV